MRISHDGLPAEFAKAEHFMDELDDPRDIGGAIGYMAYSLVRDVPEEDAAGVALDLFGGDWA